MGFEIRYSDLISVRKQIVSYVSTIKAQLNELGKSYDTLIQSGCMEGETVKTLNTYIAYVHENVLSLVESMLQEYMQKLLVYENGLHDLEGNREAIIFEEEIKLLSDALGRAKKKYGGITQDVTNTLSSVSDIYSHSSPETSTVESAYDKLTKLANTFQTDVGRYEHKHKDDCKTVNEYIQKINQLLSSQAMSQWRCNCICKKCSNRISEWTVCNGFL